MINKNCKIQKFKYPFPYIKIQDFLDKDFYKNLEISFPKISDFKTSDRSVSRMNYDTTYGDNLYKKLLANNESYRKLHEYIYSSTFIKYFLEIFKNNIQDEYNNNFLTEDVLNYQINNQPFEVGHIIGKKEFTNKLEKFLYPRMDLGSGIKGYGKNNGGGGIHIDNPQRLISMLFYIGGYEKIIGGEHRIWKKSNNNNFLDIHETIKPEKNCLIASLQNNLAFHDVNPIEYIEGSRNAFYLAISSSVPVWKKVKRSKFSIKYNKNRVRNSLFQKIKNILN
jgi:hypothetical protein